MSETGQELFRIESSSTADGNWFAISHIRPYLTLEQASARLDRMIPSNISYRIVRYPTCDSMNVTPIRVEIGAHR